MTQSLADDLDTNARPAAAVLEVSSVAKQYGPVRALTDLSLTVAAGEIRALVGENGSGKSTLVGIVSGTVRPDSGTVTVADRELHKHFPAESQEAGVLTVFQDGSLLPTLSVAQNLYAGTPASQRPSYGSINSWAKARLDDYALDFDPLKRAGSLAPGDRQLLEIVRGVMARPRLLMLDESTSALDASGVDRVLDLMRRAADNGSAVLFVTHRLSEVFRVADTVTILRDGRFVGTHQVADLTPAQVVESMAGTKVDLEFPARTLVDELVPPILTASDLGGSTFGPVTLTLRPGEIVGIAGADGNGQSELLRGLATLGSSSGSVSLDGVTLTSFRQAVRHGIVFVSGDRRTESLFPSLTIAENLTASALDRLSVAGFVPRGAERRFVRSQREEFGIRMGSPSHLPTSLSGGNQQKIAISRALATHPKVLLIDEPTQGVDVRSRMEIYRMLRSAADAGNAVVLVSSDASELAGISDRVIVMSRGRVIRELPGLGANEESIVGAFAVESEVADLGVTPTWALDATLVARARRRRWIRNDEVLRLGVLALLLIVIGVVTAVQNPTFLSDISLRNFLLIATPLTAVAIAQYFVLLVGGIDVSVGATMSLSVVVMSFLVDPDDVFASFGFALLVSLVLGSLVGVINAWLVEKMKLMAVIATIATLGIVSGIALTLRPTPAGPISYELLTALGRSFGVIPYALLGLIAVVVVGDVVLRRTGLGLRVRAVGINGVFANRLGIRAVRIRSGAYLICGIFAALGGVLLAAQVGIGDARVGEAYTLYAIAAPVIGGASLLGGRGTLVGALLGSLMIALLLTLATTLRISQGANLLFIGLVTLLALLTYALPLNRK